MLNPLIYCNTAKKWSPVCDHVQKKNVRKHNTCLTKIHNTHKQTNYGS